MTEKEKLLELDNLISEMELCQERARTMASDIDQEYFDETDDQYKLYLFDQYSVKFDILFDYVFKNIELLQEARTLLKVVKHDF